MHFKEIRCEDIDCINLAKGRAQLRALMIKKAKYFFTTNTIFLDINHLRR
jgi:hypothetical protein